MYRATTPTHTFTLPFDTSEISELKLTYQQKGRTLEFTKNDVTAMWLKKYLKGRKYDTEYLFAKRGNDKMTADATRDMLRKLSARSGVDNVHPHRFRRTLATNLIRRGMNIQEVAAVLGHTNINTTMTYVYMSDDTVKSSYQKYA